jgi:DNA (cytosine-5)-methyltransferase 1
VIDDQIQSTMRAVDLFCGSGAVSEALSRNGFKVVAAVDNDPVACRTYRANHPGARLLDKDISTIDPSTDEAFAGGEQIELLVVCAPCQPFSSQNRKRGADDPRANLLLESIKFARALKPACILFENVPGLASSANLAMFEALQGGLRQIGYTLSKPRRIDASALGVPQRRIRCVMVATPSEAGAHAFQTAKLATSRMTVGEAIRGLRELSSGETDPDDDLHSARNHNELVLRRLSHIPKDGGSRSALPSALELRCHRGRLNSFPDVYGRMAWNDVAPTLTTGCTDLTRGRFVHPFQDRAITLREAALLQTFPRHYRFEGNKTQVARQIGNAVPVKMVEALLPTLRSIIAARQLETGI